MFPLRDMTAEGTKIPLLKYFDLPLCDRRNLTLFVPLPFVKWLISNPTVAIFTILIPNKLYSQKICDIFVIFGRKLVEIGRLPYSGAGIKKAPNSLKFGAFALRSL